MDKNEWEILLWDIARKAADERYKLHDDGFMPQVIANRSKEDATGQFADEFAAKLLNDLKYEDLDDEDRRVIKNYPITDMTNWLMGAGKSPMEKSWEDKFDKFQSLLADNVSEDMEQPNWTNMDFVNDPAARKAAKDIGYNLNKVEDRGEFFKKLADFQTAYDRGIAADNMGESGWGQFNSFVNPSAYEEAQRQVITGEGTEDDLKKMAAVDAAANSLMFGLPGFPTLHKASNVLSRALNFGTNGLDRLGTNLTARVRNIGPKVAKVDEYLSTPLAASTMDALMQGGVEMNRQIAKNSIDPNLEINYAAPIAAASLGLSRPALYAAATGALNSSSSNLLRQVAKGVQRSTRSGNPVEAQKQALSTAIDKLNSIKDKTGKESISTAEVIARQNAVKSKKVLEAFDAKDKKTLLDKYDDKKTWEWEWDNDKQALTPESQERWDKMSQVAQPKLEEMGGTNAATMFGLGLGKLIGETGSRVEPTFKFAPNHYKTPIAQPDYNGSDWYNEMDPEKRAAFEKAIADLAKSRRK